MSRADALREILFRTPVYLDSTKKFDLPFTVKRVKKLENPLSKLSFEPNTNAILTFQQDNFYDAVLERLRRGRINNKLISGETSEGKTTLAIAIALYFTQKKIELAQQGLLPKDALKAQFTISHNLVLGQFETLKSQVFCNRFRKYEEVICDEFYLMCNVMRAMSGQNVDIKNTLDAGRFWYAPINGLCPGLGSIDRGVSSTRMQWLLVAEHNYERSREVNVIVKFNVHSDDNFEYKWVNFCVIRIGWCPTELYEEAQECKRLMIATSEGMKDKNKHLREQESALQRKAEDKKFKQAMILVDQWEAGELTDQECAHTLYTRFKRSVRWVMGMMGEKNWGKVDRWIKEHEKTFESGVIGEDDAREIID